jgi:hypothetical protein
MMEIGTNNKLSKKWRNRHSKKNNLKEKIKSSKSSPF